MIIYMIAGFLVWMAAIFACIGCDNPLDVSDLPTKRF